MLTRNGTRHPQVSNESPLTLLISLTMPVDASRPSGTPTCGQLAMNPRRFTLPHSIDSSTDPPHSPPPPMPWTSRRSVRITGAATPIVAWVGSRPIMKVATPISISVVIRVVLRPTRSP